MRMKTISEILAENLGVVEFVDDRGNEWFRYSPDYKFLAYTNDVGEHFSTIHFSDRISIPGLRAKPKPSESAAERWLVLDRYNRIQSVYFSSDVAAKCVEECGGNVFKLTEDFTVADVKHNAKTDTYGPALNHVKVVCEMNDPVKKKPREYWFFKEHDEEFYEISLERIGKKEYDTVLHVREVCDD